MTKKGKNATVVTDPFSEKMTGLKFPKTEADIVIVSHNHEDHNQSDQIDKDLYVISNPGEYEVKNVSVFGIATFHDNQKGAVRGKNTVFVIEMDKIRICHLGDLGHKLDEKGIKRLSSLEIKKRLEYLRGEIEAERISTSEIVELQSLAKYIDRGDVLLLEWAGVPEFPKNA